MGYKKDEIEAYKTIDSSYYIIDIDIDPQYKDVLDNINTCISNYINNPSNIIEPKNSNSLTLLLKYIRNKYLYKYDGIINNSKHINIELLDNIWNIYTNICYKFLLNPTILRFSIFVNINNNTIKDWINNRDRTNSIYSTTAKKWLSECECSLYDQAVNTNGIGAIFALKANYGYRDNYVINVTDDSKQEKTVEEIEQDYQNQLPDNNNIIDF